MIEMQKEIFFRTLKTCVEEEKFLNYMLRYEWRAADKRLETFLFEKLYNTNKNMVCIYKVEFLDEMAAWFVKETSFFRCFFHHFISSNNFRLSIYYSKFPLESSENLFNLSSPHFLGFLIYYSSLIVPRGFYSSPTNYFQLRRQNNSKVVFNLRIIRVYNWNFTSH